MIGLSFNVMNNLNSKASTLVDVLNIVLHTHLIDPQTKSYFLNIWLETINELEDNARNAVIYHLKDIS